MYMWQTQYGNSKGWLEFGDWLFSLLSKNNFVNEIKEKWFGLLVGGKYWKGKYMEKLMKVKG